MRPNLVVNQSIVTCSFSPQKIYHFMCEVATTHHSKSLDEQDLFQFSLKILLQTGIRAKTLVQKSQSSFRTIAGEGLKRCKAMTALTH